MTVAGKNNLYNFMRLVTPKLVSGLKRPFKLDGMVRVDDTPVHRAIREAVVNMLIHSDYLINGVLKIVKNDHGFIFSNPGNLKLPISAIYMGGHSIARNPRIQTMFRMIGYGDNIGSGFPTILSAWGEENWRKPDLNQDELVHQVELKLWMISTMPPECTEYLKNHFGLACTHLANAAQIILGTAYLEGEVTNVRMQSMLDMHSTDIGQILSELVNKDMLIANRKGRWTSYRINEEYVIAPEQLNISDVDTAEISFSVETDRLIYEYIKVNGFITTRQVLTITSLTTTGGASAALGRLMKADLVKKVRDGKHFIYQLVK